MDLISREKAIDAVENEFVGNGYDIAEVIRALPSEKPEIIVCGDDKTNLENYSDTLWRLAYERGRKDAERRQIIHCKDCAKERVCRFAQYQGENGFCSLAERREDG